MGLASGRCVPVDGVAGVGVVAAVDPGSDVDAEVLRESGVVFGEAVQRGGDGFADGDSCPFGFVGCAAVPAAETDRAAKFGT
jgi:hypothetical protein